MKVQKALKKQRSVVVDVNDFSNYWTLNLRMLWWMGIVIDLSESGLRRPFRLVERLPTFVTNAFGIIDGVFQVFWMCDIWSTNPLLVTQISSNFLSNVTVICKVFIVWLHNIHVDVYLEIEKEREYFAPPLYWKIMPKLFFTDETYKQ